MQCFSLENRGSKEKVFNRSSTDIPYHRLSFFIEYKAIWLGIKVSERITSKTCHKCRIRGLRVVGLFKCPICGY
ncbi:MAG: zinc ribbon domain-containing protein [Nitrososphaerota archaeon]